MDSCSFGWHSALHWTRRSHWLGAPGTGTATRENRDRTTDLRWNFISRHSGPNFPQHRAVVSNADGKTRHSRLSPSDERGPPKRGRVYFRGQEIRHVRLHVIKSSERPIDSERWQDCFRTIRTRQYRDNAM